MNSSPWRTHKTTKIYNNPWIEVLEDDVTNPSGNPGIYGRVSMKNTAVGIVPIDKNGNTWLVGQYRYTLNQYSWEIPMGGCPKNEAPLEGAKRELLEETGIEADTWEQICKTHTSNSITDEEGILYLATDLSVGNAHPEETEALKIRNLPLKEAVQMVIRGEITDAMSMIALLYLKSESKSITIQE